VKIGRLAARLFAIVLFSLAIGAGLFFKAETSLIGVAAFVSLASTIATAIIAVSQERHQRRWVVGACALTFVTSLLLLATGKTFSFSDVLVVLACASIASALIIFAARGTNGS